LALDLLATVPISAAAVTVSPVIILPAFTVPISLLRPISPLISIPPIIAILSLSRRNHPDAEHQHQCEGSSRDYPFSSTKSHFRFTS
jgi:hypothetical protein